MISYTYDTPTLIREFHYFDWLELSVASIAYPFTPAESKFSQLSAEGYTCLPIATYYYNGTDDDITGLEIQVSDPVTGTIIATLGTTGQLLPPKKYLYTQNLQTGLNDIIVNTFTGNLTILINGFTGFNPPTPYGMGLWFIYTVVPAFP